MQELLTSVCNNTYHCAQHITL